MATDLIFELLMCLTDEKRRKGKMEVNEKD
jgi:hypothetical protein